MKAYLPHCRFLASSLILLCTSLSHTLAAPPQLRLDYTVSVTDPAKHLYHIRIQVSRVTTETLEISFPSWAPGWYTTRPFAANVNRLRAVAGSRSLPMRAIDKQTWRIKTGGHRRFTVEYDYYADNLNVNGADLTEKHGFFLGTSLFFYVPGHTTDIPATLKFEIPEGWRIATGLKPGPEQNVYLARNFEQLVDCPTVLGNFDLFTTTVLGKKIQIVIDPAGKITPEASERLLAQVNRIIESQGRMFGGLPYDDYWIFYLAGRLRGGGGLEHENSTNIMLNSIPGDPRPLAGVTSHEHFHAWNVKRIKPAGLIPYNYRREQYTRELWFAEGVTSYYGDLHLRRAGIYSDEEYLNSLAAEIRHLQNSEARQWMSLADSSMTTWLTYGGIGSGFNNYSTNYYNKGELVGLLLDLQIRGATDNRKSLDDLMRYLFRSYYRRGRGYTGASIERIASRLTGRSFKDFFAKYVNGTAELDYDAALKYAGLRLVDGKIVELEQVTEEQRALRSSWLEN